MLDEPDASDPTVLRPLSLTVASALVGLQGLVIVVLCFLEIVHLTGGRATMAVTTSVFFGLYGVGLLVCTRSLLRLASWARGPVVMAQLIQLGLAWNFREGATVVLSVVLTIVAVVTLVTLLSSTSRAALDGEIAR